MKTHIRMIVASAIVIALALTAVSGITYSWFSDTESTNISVTTATMDLKVVVNTDETYYFGKIDGTDVTFTNSLGDALEGSVENATNIAVSNLCANAYVKIPYTIKYKSDINTVARVTATVSVSVEDATGVNSALSKITLGFNGTSKELADITGTGYYEVDGKKTFEGTAELLPWTVNEATTGTDYEDLLTDNNLTISTTDDFNLSGFTFTITLKSEIYQKSYIYTSYTYDPSADILYKMPANRLVYFDGVVYSDTGEYAFTNVLLDFTECTGFDYFTMSFSDSDDGVTVLITPSDPSSDDGLAEGAEGNVTISLNYEKSLADLKMKDLEEDADCSDKILVNSTSDGKAFVVIDVPINKLRLLSSNNLN